MVVVMMTVVVINDGDGWGAGSGWGVGSGWGAGSGNGINTESKW